MITTGFETQLQQVEIIEDLFSAIKTGATLEYENAMWVAYYYIGENQYQCEYNDSDCVRDGIAWGTEDPFEPKFCQYHYFDFDSGYGFFTTQTIDELVAEYGEWLKANNLPELSADELIMETDDKDELITTEEQRFWLYDFSARWEYFENLERRNSYKGTGKFYMEKDDGFSDVWELMSVESDINLCDHAHEGQCSLEPNNKTTFYTDSTWRTTHYCKKHFDANVADGTFIEQEKK